MTDNSFCIKVRKDVISILEKLEIFQEDAFSPKDHYAESVKEVAREGTHWDIIQEVWKTHSYDLLLVDNSIFQFHKAGEDLRYCFMQNPKVKVSWKEFLNKNHLREDDIEPEMRLPVLIKKYIKQNAKVIAFNVDPNFNDAIDGLMYIRISDLPESTINPVLEELSEQLKDN